MDIPVLMGGVLPYTGMISILNENYEDGTHRYDDMLEDGMSCIVDYCYVNPEDLPDTPEAYATLAAEKLTDGGIYNILSVYQDDGYTESLSYPVYIVSFTSGNNEDTNFWLAFMVIRDGYTYLYAPSVSCNADYTAEELGQDLFPRLFFPIRWTTDAMKKHLTVICYCYVPWQYFSSRADGFSHTNMLHLTL